MAAVSTDPRIMRPRGRLSLIKKLAEIDPRLALDLEEGVIDGYDAILARQKYAGFKLECP